MKEYDQDIIEDIMNKNEPEAVDNENLLEDVMLKIKELQADVDLLEEKKAVAVGVVNQQIGTIQKSIDFLRDVILNTCQEKDEESFTFEDVGIASKSKGRESWTIKDDGDLRAYLDRHLTEEEKDVIFTPKLPAISKRDLSDILDRWEKEGKLPDCVEKQVNEDSVKIRYSKEKKK